MFTFTNYIPKSILAIGLCMFLGYNSLLYSGSIRINNRVVETGMSKGKAFLILGEPDWKSKYSSGDLGRLEQLGDPVGTFSNDSSFVGYGGSFELIGSVAVEEWLFDQGKNRLMQLLRFENERLVSIISLSYGFDEIQKGNVSPPHWSALQVGDTSYEVLCKVGDPTLTEAKPDIGFVRVFGPLRNVTLHFRSADVSWWYYNAGKNRLFRIVKMVNGRVVEITTEGFGEG